MYGRYLLVLALIVSCFFTVRTQGAIILVDNYRYGGVFVPTNLSGLAGWYDASDAATITSSGGLVSQWGDKSSAGNHLTTNANDTYKPSTGVHTLNSLNVMYLGALDYFIAPSGLRTVINNSHTIFMVAKEGDTITGGDRYFFSSNGSRALVKVYSSGSIIYSYRRNNSDSAPSNMFTVNEGSTQILVGKWGASTKQMYINGTPSAPNTNVSASTATEVYIGAYNGSGTSNQNMDIAEIIVYDRTLTDTEIYTVTDYLKDKWNGTWQLPAPYQIAGLSRWYDPSDTNTLTASSNAVSQMRNKASTATSGNFATQGTGANQPLTATATINGVNVLRYDGTDFFGVGGLPTTATIFNVAKYAAPANGSIGHSVFGGSSSGHLPVAQSGNSTTTVFLNCGTPSLYSNGVLKTPANRNEMYTDLTGYNGSTYPDVMINVFTNVTGTNLNQLAKAPSNFVFTGDMGEVLVYDRALTNAEINTIANYLETKYAGTWTDLAFNNFINGNLKFAANDNVYCATKGQRYVGF